LLNKNRNESRPVNRNILKSVRQSFGTRRERHCASRRETSVCEITHVQLWIYSSDLRFRKKYIVKNIRSLNWIFKKQKKWKDKSNFR